MNKIPKEFLDAYRDTLDALSVDIRTRLLDDLKRVDLSDVARARDVIIEIMETYLGPYTDMAAQIGATFYEGIRAYNIGGTYNALVESGRVPAATAGAVRAFMQTVVDEKPADELYNLLLSRSDYEIKRASDYSIMNNTARDKKSKKYTRVPSGFETCDFCLMLSSQGAVKVSKVSPDMRAHIHGNCHCVLVPYFEGQTIEGYDKDEMYQRWKDAQRAKEEQKQAK